jgi:hypothetical protein
MDRRHGADRLSREGRIALKNALPYRDADFAASRYSPSRVLRRLKDNAAPRCDKAPQRRGSHLTATSELLWRQKTLA